MSSKDQEKIPLSQVRKLPYKTLNRMINKAKKYLKTDKVWEGICKEYDENVDIIDYIPTMFGNLDVSAKTDHGVVILNYKLLTDGDFFKDYSYLIHEYTHWFQQCYGAKATKSSDDGSYLDNKFEQEGFQNQVEYISDQFGGGEAEQYVDDLLEHHEIDNKKEVEEKKEILMSKAERSPELQQAIRNIKKLIIKYHPDNPETGDPEKFAVLKDKLFELQGKDEIKLPEQPIPPPVIQDFRARIHPWGDWYNKP